MKLPSSRVYGGWLALARFLTGGIWLDPRRSQVSQQRAVHAACGCFRDVPAEWDRQNDRARITTFSSTRLRPNAALFAELVRFGEVCVGISLLLGLFSRVGGFVGILLPLNYLAARGALGTLNGWSSIDGCLMLLSALSFVLPTGRIAGLDALMLRPSVRRTTVVAEMVPERPLDGPTAPP